MLCSFVLTPVAFVMSAAFMISQPVESKAPVPAEVSRTTSKVAAPLNRFKELGAEYRRLTRITGVPIHRVTPRTESFPKAVEHVEPVKSVEDGGRRPTVAVLEKKVLTILEKYGRPIQKGEVLAKAIVAEALAQDYDPLFVAAVIKSESAFNSLARSHKGAQGLMQIMPKTGAWLADQVSVPRGKLTDPGHNLKLGITYLKQLEAEYGGNRVLTLIAYNWGPGRVESASNGRRRVPGQVMQYAVKILNDYRVWRGDIG